MAFGEIDVAWFAGVFEGEGYCHRHGPSIRLIVTQRDTWLCDRLKVLFGGTVNSQRNGKGRIDCWRLYGPVAVELIMASMPLLSPKRQNQVLQAYYGGPDGVR